MTRPGTYRTTGTWWNRRNANHVSNDRNPHGPGQDEGCPVAAQIGRGSAIRSRDGSIHLHTSTQHLLKHLHTKHIVDHNGCG